jgi:hypothetical protein
MSFIRPEEGRVVAVSKTPGPSLVDIFGSGASPSDAAPPSKVGGEWVKDGGKGGYGST